MTPHNSLIFLPNELGAHIVRRYVSETYSISPINNTYPRLRVCPSCQYQARLRLGYLLWEVRESDVLYSLVAGLLQEHARQPDPPQVRVYCLTRRPPPTSLRFPADSRGRSFVSFVSFSKVSGHDAAQVYRTPHPTMLHRYIAPHTQACCTPHRGKGIHTPLSRTPHPTRGGLQEHAREL